MAPKIVLQDKPSLIPILVVWPATGVLFAALFGCFALTFKYLEILNLFFITLGILGLMIATVRTIGELVQREFTTYTLTETHIIVEQGIFNHDQRKIPLDRVEGTKIEWALAGQILDYGNVLVVSSGIGIKLRSVPHPRRWSAEIDMRGTLKVRII